MSELLQMGLVALGFSLTYLGMWVTVDAVINKPKRGRANGMLILAAIMLAIAITCIVFGSNLKPVNSENLTSNIIRQAPYDNNIWAYWLTAIGTLALASVTFYMGVIAPNLFKPKFVIEFQNKKPFCRRAKIQVSGLGTTGELLGTLAYFLRIRVRNSGKSVAKSCVGKLVAVMDKSGNELEDYDPVALHWVGTDENSIPLRPIDLNQGEYEYLDVVYTIDGDITKKAYIFRDKLPRGIPSTLDPGKYRLRITIYADNAEPATGEYALDWRAASYQDIELKKR